MIILEIKVSSNGPANINLNSGTIAGIRLYPPADGSGLGIQVGNLQATSLSLSSTNGMENTAFVDVNEGPDPVWLAFGVDCTAGGSVGIGFPGSPTIRVNPGSYVYLEYNNGKPAPFNG